jgi:hypothetical protein
MLRRVRTSCFKLHTADTCHMPTKRILRSEASALKLERAAVVRGEVRQRKPPLC